MVVPGDVSHVDAHVQVLVDDVLAAHVRDVSGSALGRFANLEVAHTSCILGVVRFVGDATTAGHEGLDGLGDGGCSGSEEQRFGTEGTLVFRECMGCDVLGQAGCVNAGFTSPKKPSHRSAQRVPMSR